MDNKLIHSKSLLGALILWMVISQAIGLYSVGVPIIYFIEVANPILCIYPLLIMGLAIASWVLFTRKKYNQSLITTSLIFILGLVTIFLTRGAQFGG